MLLYIGLIFCFILRWAGVLFTFAITSDFFSPIQWVFFFVSIFSFYRAAIFIHEITHLRKGTFYLFELYGTYYVAFR